MSQSTVVEPTIVDIDEAFELTVNPNHPTFDPNVEVSRESYPSPVFLAVVESLQSSQTPNSLLAFAEFDGFPIRIVQGPRIVDIAEAFELTVNLDHPTLDPEAVTPERSRPSSEFLAVAAALKRRQASGNPSVTFDGFPIRAVSGPVVP